MPDSQHQSRARICLSHGLGLSLAACAGWGLSLIGALPLLDHLLYDRCLSLANALRETPAAVVLVAADAETLASDDHRRRLVSTLDGLGVRGIAFTQPIGGRPAVTTSGAAWVIAPDRFHDPAADVPLGQVATGCDVGFVPAPDGIYRSQQMVFSDRHGPRRSLEAAIAGKWFEREWPRPGERFHIRFQAVGESLPTVPADIVLDDGLVPELVRGRMVLIGAARTPEIPGLTGPLSGPVPMTPLEFHGHAVNSLLTQSWIALPPPLLAMTIVVLGSVVTYILCIRWPQRRRRLIGLLLVTELCMGFVALAFADVWLPVGFLWGGQGLAVSVCSARGRWQLNDLTRRLAFQVRSSLRLRREMTAADKTDDPWKELAEFIRQLLPVSRIAVYESTGRRKRTRLEKYAWTNPATGDEQMDETITRAAWAVLDNLPANVRGAPVPGGRFAYAARVTTFAGGRSEVVLVPDEGLPPKALENRIRTVIDEVDQFAKARADGGASHWPARGSAGTPGDFANGLCEGLDRLRFEFGLLEHVFDGMGTGLALYGASGLQLRENRCFRTYLSDRVGEDPAPRLVDLLAALLTNAADVRKNLRQLLLHRSQVLLTIPGRNGSREDQLRLRPIEYCWSSPLASIDASSVVRIQLVVCEWNRTESHREPEYAEISNLMELVESLQGIVSDGTGAHPVGSAATKTRGRRRPHSVPEASAEPVHA